MDPLSQQFLNLKLKVQNKINNCQAQLINYQSNSSRSNNHQCQFSSCCMKFNKTYQNEFIRQSDSLRQTFMLLIQNQKDLTKKLSGLTDHIFNLTLKQKQQNIVDQSNLKASKSVQSEKRYPLSKSLCNKPFKIQTESQQLKVLDNNKPIQQYYAKQPCPIHNPKQDHTLKKKSRKSYSQQKNKFKISHTYSKKQLNTKNKQLQKSVKNIIKTYGCK